MRQVCTESNKTNNQVYKILNETLKKFMKMVYNHQQSASNQPLTAVWRKRGFGLNLKLVLCFEVRSLIYTFG